MTNVKLYDNCDGILRPACHLCLCSATVADDWRIDEIAVPSTPSAGEIRMYANTNSIWIKDDTGATTDIGTGAGGGGGSCWEAGATGWICPTTLDDVCFATFCGQNTGIVHSNFICTPYIVMANDTLCAVSNCIIVHINCGGFSRNDCLLAEWDVCIGANGCKWNTSCSYAYTTSSDCRLKCNITDVDYKEILRRYENIPLQSWNWKTDHSKQKQLGFTAQDFQQTFGDIISVSCHGLNMADQIGMRGAAIHALIDRVKELEEKVRRKKNEK